MLNRNFLDKFLPEEQKTIDLARQALGDEVSVERVLEELRKLQADDYLSNDPRPYPQRGYGRARFQWPNFRFEGFSFKPEDHYLTIQGWPLGTECWFVRYNFGYTFFVTANTQIFAVSRAIVLARLGFKLRSQFRNDILEFIAETLLQPGPVDFQAK